MRSFVFIATISISAFLIPAHAQITKSSVLSDGLNNTAAGLDALFAEYNDEKSSSGCATSGTCGSANTAVGYEALETNTTGADNTALGMFTLEFNTTGEANTASGLAALSANISGSDNTASGYNALNANTTGNSNSAFGAGALGSNTTGSLNVAYGLEALAGATTGSYNTAIGADALLHGTSGSYNTAIGANALLNGTTGNYNTASGYEAMYDNTVGAQNIAYGLYALHGNSKGNYNAAVGGYALYSNTSGSSNIALGYKAGFYPTAGANNIHVGNLGAAGDTGVIKIGTQNTQKATSIAGIYSTSPMTGGSVVVINSAGLLGVQTVSSERFKSDIMPMNKNTTRLEQLRPVSFHYKSDPHGPVQYGLIAEEVAKVYPELVTRDEHGDVNGVRYDELAPMLLNEMKLQNQKLQRLDAQDVEIRELRAEVRALQAPQRSN